MAVMAQESAEVKLSVPEETVVVPVSGHFERMLDLPATGHLQLQVRCARAGAISTTPLLP